MDSGPWAMRLALGTARQSVRHDHHSTPYPYSIATPPQRPAPPPGIDYSKRYHVLLAIGMGISLGTIDASIVNAALLTLIDQLSTDFTSAQWVVLAYILTISSLVLSIGRLGDLVGKKHIYTAGFVVFTVGSLLAGLAPTIGTLIAFRVLQAIGAAMIFALGYAIITEAFPPTERGRALGAVGTIVSIGIVIGPALGGLIVDNASWRWIFLVNLPIGIIGTWVANRHIPAVPPPKSQRFDLPGAVILLVGLVSAMLALTFAPGATFRSPVILGLSAAGILCLITFLKVEQRSKHPLLNLTLFSDRRLSVSLVCGWVAFISISAFLFIQPFYLQDTLGYSPTRMGLLLGVGSIGLGISSPIAGSISDRISQRPVAITGLAILLLGYGITTTLSETTTAWNFAIAALIVGVGMGTFQSANNSIVLGSVLRSQLGITSGLLTVTRNTGWLIGVSVLGTLWISHVNNLVESNPATALATAQVSGLRLTMTIVTTLVALALALMIWSALTDPNDKQSATPSSDSQNPD